MAGEPRQPCVRVTGDHGPESHEMWSLPQRRSAAMRVFSSVSL